LAIDIPKVSAATKLRKTLCTFKKDILKYNLGFSTTALSFTCKASNIFELSLIVDLDNFFKYKKSPIININIKTIISANVTTPPLNEVI